MRRGFAILAGILVTVSDTTANDPRPWRSKCHAKEDRPKPKLHWYQFPAAVYLDSLTDAGGEVAALVAKSL